MPNTWDSDIRKAAEPEQARILQRFFKTGPGEYGAGDRFLGIKVPVIRTLVKKYRHDIDLGDIQTLLRSPYHEKRLFSLLLMIEKFRAQQDLRREIFDLYLDNTAHINSWDLVDVSAPHIAGAFLQDKSRRPLFRLARSRNLWERRIAMVATLHYIRQGASDTALSIAAILLQDKHDLIHKAVGWMLREIGKYCGPETEETFLRQHCTTMPRTMLRYAIERFPEAKRRAYLSGTP
ncbi:MAG: DNA alkylation repair protein [Deltaproteobacteria bacterium]|nr:DNA alkylation repair protein [Deltaproteobacteria bacterium]